MVYLDSLWSCSKCFSIILNWFGVKVNLRIEEEETCGQKQYHPGESRRNVARFHIAFGHFPICWYACCCCCYSCWCWCCCSLSFIAVLLLLLLANNVAMLFLLLLLQCRWPFFLLAMKCVWLLLLVLLCLSWLIKFYFWKSENSSRFKSQNFEKSKLNFPPIPSDIGYWLALTINV